MADVKISALPAASAGASTQEFPANDSGTTKKVTGAQLLTLVQTGADAFTVGSGNIVTDATTARTLSDGDNGKTIVCTSGSAVAVTLGTGRPAGFACLVVALGAGQVTLTASGTTLRARNGLKSAGQYAVMSVANVASETYVVGGDCTT